jgi:hypothetical protein
MKFLQYTIPVLLSLCASVAARAQTGPFSPEDWPATRDPSKVVHYYVTGDALTAPSDTWTPNLRVLSGGDQVTGEFTIGGFTGLKVLGNYLNVADDAYTEWADNEFVDILVQAYGDAALFNAAGEPRNFNFLIGTLPELNFPIGGQVPVEARNRKWNWILFRIPNDTRASDGSRFIGSIPANAQGDTSSGGVNGGTIRFEGVPNLIVRAIAFGEEGAFGSPEAINVFSPPDTCDPEPETNLVGLDIQGGVTNRLVPLNDGDQTVTIQDGVGPANDKRRAVLPNGTFLNFGITDNFLGLPCNDPRTVKVCVEFYDDPAFAGGEVRFGPDAYATDGTGGIATLPSSQRHLLTGTGQWIKRSWTIPAVNLKGVNTGSLTGGPRFASENGQVAVSRIDLAVMRTGSHPLAGQDPLADCYEDPNVCTDTYGSYAELDLAQNLRNGLDTGSSGGDQAMIIEEAGPASDRRMAIRPARDDGPAGFSHQFLNFAILEEALGPTTQPNARLAICVTYYDDPALVGARFKPEVYMTDRDGLTTFAFTPDSFFVTLEGTDRWREAYWELPDVKFNGVNQGPQAAARFVVSDKVFVTRVRYAVIRPCGPNAGKNALEECRPRVAPVLNATVGTGGSLELRWPASVTGAVVESMGALTDSTWQPVTAEVTSDGDQNVMQLTPSSTTFYRLRQP